MPPRPATASIRWPAKTDPISTWSAMRGAGCLLAGGEDRDDASAPAVLELHRARPRGEDRVVLADAHAVARLEAGPALAHDDLAAGHDLAGEHLHAEALGGAVAPVAAGAESLLVSHRFLLPPRDVQDLEPRQVGAGAHPALVAALRLELEHVDLLAALVPADDRLDLDLAEVVGRERGVLAVAGDEQGLERHRGALVLAHPVDEQAVALLDAVLLTAGFDDGVHQRSMSVAAGTGPQAAGGQAAGRGSGPWPPAA